MTQNSDLEHEHGSATPTDHPGSLETEVIISDDGYEVTVDSFAADDTEAKVVFAAMVQGIDLGAIEPWEQSLQQRTLRTALAALERHTGPFTVLSWHGLKVPRITINGRHIHTTQNGFVLDTRGGTDGLIGKYHRLVEFGGPEHDEHRMLVLLPSSEQAS